MIRHILIAALLCSGTSALARVGPEIVYASGKDIHLVNPDGSGAIRIYRGRGSGFIDSVSLKKGGGTVAFVEDWVLKFIDYDASGRQVGPIRSVAPVCYRIANVNYHPDGQSVIYHESCNGIVSIKQVAVPTASNPSPQPVTLVTNPDIIDVGGFDGAGQSFVYTLTSATAWELRRYYLSGSDQLVATKAPSGPQFRHPALRHDGSLALVAHWTDSSGPSGTGYTSEYATASGAVARSNFITGQRGDYAPDDIRIVFRNKEGRTTYLRFLDANGLPRPIASSTAFMAFHDVDWGD